MKSIRIFIGSVVVYLVVTMIYGCKPSMPHGVGSGGGGGMVAMSSTTASAGGTAATGGKGGTGPVPDANADQSGSRLKAQRWSGSDGSSANYGMYDSLLKIKCSFSPMADGNVYCVPASGGYVTDFYGDAACTQHLATISSSLALCPPAYAISATANTSCGPYSTTIRAYPVGAKFASAVYLLQGATCGVSPNTPGSDFYTVGAELPMSSLVSATVTTDP